MPLSSKAILKIGVDVNNIAWNIFTDKGIFTFGIFAGIITRPSSYADRYARCWIRRWTSCFGKTKKRGNGVI